VEDNPEIRYYLKQSLHANYEVIEASNGKTGYKQALQQIPDLVITDVMMPEMDGIELCKVLKNELLTQHIPIIILSAKSTIEDTLEGLETGADDYVPKPFNEQILLAKIKTLLANRQKIVEKYQTQPYKESQSATIESLHFEDPFVERVVDYIVANLSDEALSNEKIELHFKTNKMQLYRKLKAVTGWSVNTLIREIKIREATRLLKESEMNISEVAYKLGFSDPLYFSKYFKKEVGVAPQQYRKEH
jgi:YesN/AraC family two-component response regulator